MDNRLFEDIISLFSTYKIDELRFVENHSEVKLDAYCIKGRIPEENEFKEKLSNLNVRDSLHISILQDEEVVDNYDTSSHSTFKDFINSCTSCLLSGEFNIILTVTKNRINQTISIYYPDVFINYISELSLIYFFEIINKAFNNQYYIIFEVQNYDFVSFQSDTICFVSKGNVPCIRNVQERGKKLNQIKNLCSSNILTKYQLLPEDFLPIKQSDNTQLNELFRRTSLIYSAVFLFDIFSFENEFIEYKLNGYRTLNQTIKISNVDSETFEIYYQIYQWVYDSGNIIDKIGLSRNIISLNLDFKNLKLSETTFSAIQSSYKIYQKENIKQYIEIRNKISDQLLELQNKADKIVDNFISDYKKSIFTVVSFFISVLVIRVVTKGDFIGGFSFEVTLLSLAFLLISAIVLIFTRREVNKQIERYKKYYVNLKSRYTDLLHESDIDRILNYDVDFKDNKSFIEQKRDDYTKIWIASLIILFLVIIILYFANSIVVIGGFFIKLFLIPYSCYIKNILP